MSTTPPIQYSGPVISPSVEQETRRHLQLIYQKLGNHTQAFSLQQQAINNLKPGSTTTIVEGGSGGGGGTTTATGTPVNNQSGQTSYSTVSGDNNALIVFSDAAAIAVTLNSQTPPWSCFIANQGALGAGTVTLTPFTGTISYAGNPGATSMPLLPTYCALVAFDGTNWWGWTEPISPQNTPEITSQWLNSYDSGTGAFTQTQPSFSDISGTAVPSQLPVATSSSEGIVQPDNVTITISGGVISAVGAGGSGVGITIDGSGSTPGTGVKGYFQVDYSGTIVGWSIIADQVGSVAFDIWKASSSAPPAPPTIPTSANIISASAGPSLSSAQSASEDAAGLTGWTTAVARYDVFGFNLDSISTITRVNLQLIVQKD